MTNVKSKPKSIPNFGKAPFILDATDLALASDLGLLDDETPIERLDRQLERYGVAYNRQISIGSVTHSSKKAIQARWNSSPRKMGSKFL